MRTAGNTERVNLAKKYPQKVASLRALFEQQAQEHHLYPLITWDDVLNGRIHQTHDGKTFDEKVQQIAHPIGN